LALVCVALQAYALDLLQSYDAALTEDSEYRTARAAAETGRELTSLAIAQLLPSISLNGTQMKNALNTQSKDILGNPTSTDTKYESNSYSLTLRQPLYRPALYAGYQQAVARVAGVEANFDKATQDVAIRVAEAYFNVMLADESLRLTESQAQAIEAQLASAKLALSVGHGARTDIDDAQARLDLNRARQLGARQQIDQARHELQILVNRPVDGVRSIDGRRSPQSTLQTTPLTTWIERAEGANPELRDLQARVAAAHREVDRAYAGHKPTLDLIAQRSISENDSVTNLGPRYDNTQVGVQLSVPLFAGGYVNAQVRQAQSALEEAEQRLENTRRKLAAEVRKGFRGIEEGSHKIRALQQAEQSAEQSVTSNKKGFLAGTRTRVDILNAEENRSTTRLELTRERISYALAHARLLSLCGALDRDSVAEMNRWLSE
jgi:outer membrane protein/protease secretion system outer membrane protein